MAADQSIPSAHAGALPADKAFAVAAARPGTYSWMFVVTLVLALGLFGAGVYVAATKADLILLAGGGVGVIAVLTAWAATLATSSASIDATLERRLHPLTHKLDETLSLLQLVSEQQLISDRAKAIAFRDRDREAFRRAIEEDISKGDFEAALALVAELEKEFGVKGEVARLKAEVNNRRDTSLKQQLDTAIAGVDRYVESEQWPAAIAEAQRLSTVYPDQVRIQMLPAEIEDKRQTTKRNLLVRWQETVRAKQIDDAIHVLRKLDLYLTPVEAAALEEDARMVFKEKLAMLRVDLTNAVQAHRWREAKRLAEIVMNDFPNTQMAREVRDMLPTLEERLREANHEGMPAMAS